jgi:hypothetical protein
MAGRVTEVTAVAGGWQKSIFKWNDGNLGIDFDQPRAVLRSDQEFRVIGQEDAPT